MQIKSRYLLDANIDKPTNYDDQSIKHMMDPGT
jgi:hypothetical protein